MCFIKFMDQNSPIFFFLPSPIFSSMAPDMLAVSYPLAAAASLHRAPIRRKLLPPLPNSLLVTITARRLSSPLPHLHPFAAPSGAAGTARCPPSTSSAARQAGSRGGRHGGVPRARSPRRETNPSWAGRKRSSRRLREQSHVGVRLRRRRLPPAT